jgi:hypothetical protein
MGTGSDEGWGITPQELAWSLLQKQHDEAQRDLTALREAVLEWNAASIKYTAKQCLEDNPHNAKQRLEESKRLREVMLKLAKGELGK